MEVEENVPSGYEYNFCSNGHEKSRQRPVLVSPFALVGSEWFRAWFLVMIAALLFCPFFISWAWISFSPDDHCGDGPAQLAQQSQMVQEEDISTSHATVGFLKLFYNPACKRAFASVVLSRQGTAELSVQMEVYHSSYIETYDTGILHQHEAWSVLAPITSGMTISASATILSGGGVTVVGETPNIFFFNSSNTPICTTWES